MSQQKPQASNAEATPQAKSSLRGADFKIGLILFTVASLLFYFTRTTFPISDSYGGVENQWYVSPALFPLAVLAVLMFCALALLFRAVKDGGHKQFLNLKSWTGNFQNSKNRDRWYIISLLILYVYVFIPSVDFYLATVLFLMSLTLRFYLDYKKLLTLILFTHCLLTVVLLVLRYKFAPEFYFFTTEVSSDEKLILYSDLATLTALLAIASTFVVHRREHPKKIAYMLCTSLLVPLILIIIFNYFLYVPMPVEQGSVIKLLNVLAYDIIGLQ